MDSEWDQSRLKRLLLGNVLTLDKLGNEKLSVLWGLPIMASDAVSSVAYAIEEILLALLPAMGFLAIEYVGIVVLPIILLLLILVLSYSQIIKNYPNGGGAYAVTKEIYGSRVSRLAASCLIIDYIMTVAVSVSSSMAAVIAALPGLHSYKVVLSLAAVFIITFINLRGVSESSKVFGVPTYLFILSMAALITTGVFRLLSGTLRPISYGADVIGAAASADIVGGLTILLFLRAFASGCSALTGIEAVSNAVPSFKKPAAKTANSVLFILGAIIVFIIGGTSLIANALKVAPVADKTVLSQIASALFGNSLMFYFLQATTALILLLAANTAYSGLPVLLSILAKDGFMPRQFAQLGAKLSFSNGILFLLVAASLLLILYRADTHSLIPFYSVGVFISFTLSQAGILAKWLKSREKGWLHKSVINFVGALVTAIGSVVVFTMKCTQGAWALAVVIPLIMMFMKKTYDHYAVIEKQISLDGYHYVYTESKSNNAFPCIVLVGNMNKAMLKTLDYVKGLSSNITALHISISPEHTARLREQWECMKIGIPLTIKESPYRNLLASLEEYIAPLEKNLKKGEHLTVVFTKFIAENWRDIIFHNQTAYFIEKKLSRHKDIITILVPYVYKLCKKPLHNVGATEADAC